VVHEWNSPELVARIGAHRRRARYQLLFHDTHHRSVTAPREMARYRLEHYDGVLAFGEAIRRVYLERGWAARAWTWHEAADARVFYPRRMVPRGDLVWIGNWGDDERTAELGEFLLTPAKLLGLSGAVYGVRYPDQGRAAIEEAGLRYRGWVPNHKVPEVMSSYRVTVHVPRRPYVKALPGVPTIRMFEALASGVPLVSAPWRDDEGLFTAGRDYLVARNGREMRRLVRAVLADADLAARMADSGRRTVLARHTCGHRVDQLLGIVRELRRHSGAREQAQHAARGAA
jgi:spore maturation protein CgeB